MEKLNIKPHHIARMAFFFYISLALLVSCSYPSSTGTDEKKEYKDGWEIVGKRGNCVLLTKSIDGNRVFWSVCEGYGFASTSVAK